MTELLFVNGTLMRGLPLHRNLAGASFLGERRTAARYRLHTIDDVHPAMYEVDHDGVEVAGELYQVPAPVWEAVSAGEPPGLYRGSITLHDGARVDAILYPRSLAVNYPDISEFGGWRAYLAARAGVLGSRVASEAAPNHGGGQCK